MSKRRDRPIPLPHQEEGIRFLRSRSSAALFDEQGLGKSKQLIEAIAQDVASGQLDGALIICPNTLKTTWAEEIELHSDLRYAIFGAGKKARRETFRSLKAALYVINYEAVPAEQAPLRALLKFKRLALVLDESHRIKSPTARVTHAVLQLRREATKRYIMTGTPVANKPEDLWSQVLFLDDGEALGATFEAFRARYMSSPGSCLGADELRSTLSSIALRREKEGTIKLPPKTFRRVVVSLRGEQERLYCTMRDELAVWVSAIPGEQVLAEADNILSRLLRLAQLASNPALIDTSYQETPVKFLALDELLSTVLSCSSSKAILWTSFVGNIPTLCRRYGRYQPVALHGEMDSAARDNSVMKFREDAAVRLLVANPAAAREGLTLTSASTAIYVDRTFNLVDYLQSQDRIHRLSQKRACEIILLIAQETIDEFVDFSLAQKHRLARYVQGDDSSISVDDLALRKPDLLRALLYPKATGALC